MSQTSRNVLKKEDMVHWYNPLQLIKTGYQVIISMLLRHRDYYGIHESFAAADQRVFNYSDRGELWIDYVADVGDGWNPTYTVASLLALDELKLIDPNGNAHKTKRGNVLIMGGDEVYPVASREGYRERLVAPYECALEYSNKPHPHLFAIPGNHDWYDGLISFVRLFCQKRWIGGWQTQQARSYFALRLPHHWWLLGVDTQQLESSYSDIDGPQLEYFQKVAEKMENDDRVILCTPQPDWIYANIYDKRLQNNMVYLEQKVIEARSVKLAEDKLPAEIESPWKLPKELQAKIRYDNDKKLLIFTGLMGTGEKRELLDLSKDIEYQEAIKRLFEMSQKRRVVLRLSGDLHHYRRHKHKAKENDNSWGHMIIAGGGGAFLHPTHVNVDKTDNIEYGPAEKSVSFEHEAEFPNRKDSRRKAFWNLLFPAINCSFGLLPGAYYVILSWAIPHHLDNIPLTAEYENLVQPFKQVGEELIGTPSGLACALFGIAAFIFFTETHKIAYRLLAGGIHGLAHLLAALLVIWAVDWFTVQRLGLPYDSARQFIAGTAGTFMGGYLAGSFLMGLYLLVSLNVFKRHSNEAFSSLRIQDYKNFLRLHLDDNGALKIFPIGIESVPREWVANNNAGPNRPKQIPKGNGKIEAQLIEGPIPIK
ncbi:MAG: hypothetical protein V3W19_09960 [Desulfatiglandales bacterium]